MQMSDLKQPDGPPRNYTPGRTGFLFGARRNTVGQFPAIWSNERNPVSLSFQRPKLSFVNAVIFPLLCQALNFKVTQQASPVSGLFVLTCIIN